MTSSGKTQTIFTWLQDGSTLEDSPVCRASNHFHNPLKPFTESGVSDRALEQFLVCSSTPYNQRYGNARWGTRYTTPITLGAPTGNAEDWDAARHALLNALILPLPTDREAAFATTFQTLGHLLHLVQDLAVPAHVRNDFGSHFDFCYPRLFPPKPVTSWCENAFERYVRMHSEVITPGAAVAATPNERVVRFWDTGDYQRTRSPSADLARGLSEYTSANFLSLNTVQMDTRAPSDIYYFPHPSEASTTLPTLVPQRLLIREVRAEDNVVDSGLYIDRTGEGERVVPLAKVGYLWGDLMQKENPLSYLPLTLQLDEHVHAAYARLLVPKAVAYSAGLLDYFFRGKLEAKREWDPETGGVRLRIANRSQEPLGEGGVLTVYQDAGEGANAQRTALASHMLVAAVPPANDATPLYLPLPGGTPRTPLTLVYQGPLGQEAGAVIGTVLKAPLVEQVYWDAPTQEWVLRTAAGLYTLPLEATAGLAAPLRQVTWGEADHQLVGRTDATGPDGSQALLFELNRPQGSIEVPTAGTAHSGRPLVVITLQKQVQVEEVLSVLDLKTTLALRTDLQATQYAVTYTVATTCRDMNPDPAYDAYDCTSTTGDDAVQSVGAWHQTASATLPLRLDPAHHWVTGEPPPQYAWSLWDLRADRAGHLVATLGIESTAFPSADATWDLPLQAFTPNGALGPSGLTIRVKANSPTFQALVVVDLTDRRLLAKSSADSLTLTLSQREAIPGSSDPLLAGVRYDTTYIGGTWDGRRTTTWGSGWVAGSPVGLPSRLGTTLIVETGSTLTESTGRVGPALAALGLGEIDARGTTEIPLFGAGLWYRTDPDGTAVILQGRKVVPVSLGPARADALRWTGPSPGRLAVQWSAWEDPNWTTARSWFIDWPLAAGAATLTWTATTPDPWVPFATNAGGTLARRWSGAPGWLWAPRTGAALELPDLPYWAAYDYVALDPDALYNIRTGRFHILAPGLPSEDGPPPLAPSTVTWGDYHVVGP